ncbi:MAG TPA: FecR domain-containing protein [Dissulfurispiraceae bacterium]|nr:FecR domain-containing protein [Dissulfurispiraceae bacterium]
MTVLQVMQGDTLSGICERYLDRPSRWDSIARINRLENPHLIVPGQKLKVPVRFLKKTEMAATVTFVNGDPEVRSNRKGVWMLLKQGDKVMPGSLIRTDGDSSAGVEYDDGTALWLRPKTQLGVVQAEQRAGSTIIRRFFLGIGKAISDFKAATGADSRYEIKTPSAVASPRGTTFRVAVDYAKTTRSEVIEGHVVMRAGAKSTELAGGQGSVARKGAAPSGPEALLEPPKAKNFKPVYKSLPISFYFDLPDAAVYYRAAVTEDSAGQQALAEKIAAGRDAFIVNSLKDGSYYLTASGIDSRGFEGLPAEPVKFNLRTTPMAPIIQSPGNGADIHAHDVTVRWLKVPDAVRYRFQLTRGDDFTAPIADKSDITDTEAKTGRLEPGQYNFRVCAVAADDFEGEWSDVMHFSVAEPPPSPQVEKPDVGGEQLHFAWRNMGPGMKYHFQMAKDEAFSSPVVDISTDKPEFSVGRPGEAGTYYVRTSTVEPSGYEGPFSAPQSFELKGGFPYAAGAVFILMGVIFLIAI